MVVSALFLLLLAVACVSCDSTTMQDVFPSSKYVEVQSTTYLDLFFPRFTDMQFYVGNLSDIKDENVIFCCGAAFTGSRKFTVDYSNVAGPYVSDGILYDGYDCPYNAGAFVYSKGNWEFICDSLAFRMEQMTSNHGGMAFSQIMCMPDTNIRDVEEDVFFTIGNYRLYTSMGGNILFRSKVHKYRALCEKEDRLCIAQMQTPSTYQIFKEALRDAGIGKAIYLDVGLGWSYGWYRIDEDNVQEIGMKIHPFVSNWLLFLK